MQIDFVADFNVDTVAFNPAGALTAQCVFTNGTGVNPPDFACATLPVLGTTWQGSITLTTNTIATLLAYSDGGIGTPVPVFGGELLLNPLPSLSLFTGFGSYSIPIPASSTWLGTVLALQGVRVDVVGGTLAIVPLNAQQLVLGL